MEGLIKLIFENPFLLFIIIAGVVSFFNRMTAAGKNQQEGKQEAEGETGGRQTIRDVMRKMQEMAESLDPEAETKETKSREEKKSSQPLGRFDVPSETTNTYSFEEQREEQYRQLQKQYGAMTETDEVDQAIDVNSPIYEGPELAQDRSYIKEGSQVEVNLKSRLNREGLVESVVMAEILGPPRARKRHSNRYMDR